MRGGQRRRTTKQQRAPRRRRRRLRIGRLAFLVVLAGLCGAAGGYHGRPAAPADPGPFSDQVNHLLLVVTGHDTPAGAELLALVTIDPVAGVTALRCLPPAAEAPLAGLAPTTLRDAHAVGGIKLTAKAVANLLQHDIHHYLECDPAGLAGLLDAVGGVETSPGRRLGGAEAAELALAAGEDEAALPARQERLVAALLAQLGAAAPSLLPDALAGLAGHLSTSLTPEQFAWLTGQAGALVAAAAPVAPALLPEVTVYNGSDRLGLERVVCRRLAELGFHAVPGAVPVVAGTARTTVFPVDPGDAAARLAGLLGAPVAAAGLTAAAPPASAEATDGAPRVVLVVGSDWPDR